YGNATIILKRAKPIAKAKTASPPRPSPLSRQLAPAPASAKVGTSPRSISAARLPGPRDIRIARIPYPGQPGPGQALPRGPATGICGSDMHTFADARIGDVTLKSPLVLGHEFAGFIEAVGSGVENLRPAMRVAVDPAHPCHRCDLCESGHPNLCRRLHFCGLF